MGCGCIKVPFGTVEQKRKTTALAQRLAEEEQQKYVIYEREDKEQYIDSFAGWESGGRPGTLRVVIEP
jgi:hypothetical protein